MQDTYSVVKRVIPEGATMCGLCSRLRRGVLYRVAGEVGATKIALGHHRDDILETFFLNLFFGGKLKAMPPKLTSDDGRHVVIRPLAYVPEEDLAAWAEVRQFPIIPCNLCGSQENLQRAQAKQMLREWEKRHPGRVESIFRALGSVAPSHLLDRCALRLRRRSRDRCARCARRPRVRSRHPGAGAGIDARGLNHRDPRILAPARVARGPRFTRKENACETE